MSCGDIEQGQHWLKQWLDATQHQAITWTIVDLSYKLGPVTFIWGQFHGH